MTVALLATCTAQAFRPGLVDSLRSLWNELQLELEVPSAQTCCGLTAWDAGQREAAIVAARHTLRVFSDYDAVIALSARCLRMLREHIPALLAHSPESGAAQKLAARSSTWVEYLAQSTSATQFSRSFAGKILYYETCTAADADAARRLLSRIHGATLLPATSDACCGAGINLQWRHPELSRAMARPVAGALRLSGADVILASELNCLLQIEPFARASGGPPIRHLAEFLANPDAR